MMKNKTKILITLAMVAVFVMLFAITSMALEINLTFKTSDDKVDTSYGEKGVLEIEAGVPYKLPTKTVDAGYSFNWYTPDGRAWEGGTEVVFYEDTTIRQITLLDVSDFATFKTCAGNGTAMRLTEDIEGAGRVTTVNWGIARVFLNGHNINITGTSTAFGGDRTGIMFYGSGKVTYSGGEFLLARNHGWGGDCCRLFIGRDVIVEAPNAILIHDNNGYVSQGYPYLQIYGKATCKIAMQMGHSTQCGPRLEVNEGAVLFINEKLTNQTSSGNNIKVNLRGGSIVMTNSTYSFFRDTKATYTITGGSYSLEGEDQIELSTTIDITTLMLVDFKIDGVDYKAVVPKDCNAGTHSFKLIQTTASTCGSITEEVHQCEGCSHKITFRYGTFGTHEYEFSDKKDATKTELGWERYVCKTCKSAEYRVLKYDPANDTIKVTVLNGSGQSVDVDAVIKDIFTLTETSTGYSITDIKAFGDYTVDSIKTIIIPIGVVSVNFGTNRAGVKEIIIDDGAIVTIESLAKLTALETITIKQATVTFNAKCAPSTLKTINSTVEGANVTFLKEAFTEITSVSALNLTKNSTYTFGQDSFKKTTIKKLHFPDGANVTFSQNAAFYEAGVEELYFGTGITSIAGSTFYGNANLKSIVLMSITSIGDSAFEGIAEGAYVYHHADSLSAGNNSFKNIKNLSVYTIAKLENANAFVSSTGFQIHYGIKHAYTAKIVDASCTQEGGTYYETACPCGEVKDAIYKLFTGAITTSTNYTVVEMVKYVTPKSAHNLTVLLDIRYDSGYTNMGTGVYECSFCYGEIDESEPTQSPLLCCYGFATREYLDAYGMSTRYEINRQAIDSFVSTNGGTFEIGMVVALKDRLGANTPLKADGSAQSGVMKINLTSGNTVYYELALTGIKDTMLESSYVMCFYIIDGSSISYVQDNETIKNPSGVSYNEIYDITHIEAVVPASNKD
ncbi:MAG: leucine-rich repeat protein [Clostridia bacterium]|nr:leucine-rich repeat protein [Clostridia bacterium]